MRRMEHENLGTGCAVFRGTCACTSLAMISLGTLKIVKEQDRESQCSSGREGLT